MTPRLFRTANALFGALLGALAGCTSYRPLPLPSRPDLAASLSRLDLALPGGAAAPINLAQPLTVDEVGFLAMLNNAGLRAGPAVSRVAHAQLLQATLLPNPTSGLGYGALVAGPGTASSLAASLGEDVASFVVRGARIKSAKAHAEAVDAELLWREWQVAQKARQLAVAVYAGGRAIALTRQEVALLSQVVGQVRKAIAAGNLTVAALAPLLSAEAAARESLASERLTRLKDRQALDLVMGLAPDVRFALARPVFRPVPRDLAALLAQLPERRPDLLALRFGYRSTEERLRAAILGQFPALRITGSYASDTSKVVTIGPTFDFVLPVFDQNQGHIAESRATRQVLRAQYQAQLDNAVATVRALAVQIGRLSADLGRARKATAAAAALAATARRAYEAGNLDQRSLTDFATTALSRALRVIALEKVRDEDRVLLSVELGLGLPPARIAPPAGETRL